MTSIEQITEFTKSYLAGKGLNLPTTPLVTNDATQYQDQVVSTTKEDSTLTDYNVAYKRLNQERNAGWKLNPSDIADFYLLERFIHEHATADVNPNDATYLAVAKARARIGEIGQRLLVALSHEQLAEYDRFTSLKPERIPAELQEKIHAHARAKQAAGGENDTQDLKIEMNAYLADFKAKLDAHTSRHDVTDALADQDMVSTSLQILETQQLGRWQVVATAMRVLFDRSYSMSHMLPQLGAASKEVGQALEQQRDTFLIDRLLNYVHNTGTLSSRITNYFPRAVSLLLAHGMPHHEQYLLYHSSLVYGQDTLASQLKRSLPEQPDSDIVGDLARLVQERTLPREYEYGLLLEFGDPQLQAAIARKGKQGTLPTPSRVYNLLYRVSRHDGTSLGRLKQVPPKS